MNKIFKITGWVLALLGIVFGILAFVNEGSSVDLLLRYTYFLFFAAVVIWIGLAIFIAGRNNPKNLLKAAGVVVGVAALVVLAYVLSAGAPALNVKTQPTPQWLKLTDTMLLLTYVLGGAAIIAIIVGAVRDAINNK
jgi:ABC-type dipeptide/oligopeptide/nickel transport system permease component